MYFTKRFIKQVLDATPDACIIVDAKGTIVFANRQMQQLFGHRADELKRRSIEMLIPERFRVRHQNYQKAFSVEPSMRTMGQGTKIFGLRQDGTEIPIEVSLSPVKSRAWFRRGGYVICSIRDATIHRELEERLTGIFEKSLNEIYVFHTNDYRFIQVNEGARKNLGYSMDELREMTPLDIKPEYNSERFEQLIRSFNDHIDDSQSIVLDTLHKRKDDSTYPVEIHLQKSYYESTPVFMAIALDITERKHAENVLRQSHEELEQRVAARTVALDEARAEADRANNSKSRFLAAASHDLRQPLQSLGLYLSVLSRHLKANEARHLKMNEVPDLSKSLEVTEKMQTSLGAMGELLDTLLDISKLEAGSIMPDRCDSSLKEILKRVATSNIQQATEKGLSLNCETADSIVYTDPVLLERIIENFVSNAIRYTEQGSVNLKSETNGEFAVITVSDSGVGIPEDMLDKVFDEYYQLDNQVRDRRQGLGLGLAIVKHLANLLELNIGVTSVLGVGSTFRVQVPLGESAKQNPSQKVGEQDGFKAGTRPKILLVDDDQAIVDATSMLLDLANTEVFTAYCAEEALAHLETGVRPNLLISDYRLPEYTGIELIHRVRGMTSEELRSVLITGDTSAIAEQVAQIPACTLLHKPIDTNRLLSIIDEIR